MSFRTLPYAFIHCSSTYRQGSCCVLGPFPGWGTPVRTRDPCSKKTALAISNSFLLTLVSIRITWGLINWFLGSTTEFPGDSDAGFGVPILIICVLKCPSKEAQSIFFFVGGGTVTVLVQYVVKDPWPIIEEVRNNHLPPPTHFLLLPTNVLPKSSIFD